MTHKYYKTSVPWVGEVFIFQKNQTGSITTHFSDGTPFCSCSFNKEHCVNENFSQETGPCPKCLIKCDQHVKQYKIQANPTYLKHALKNPKTHMACAFCQRKKSKKMDVHTKQFFEMPYPQVPSFSFLDDKGIHIEEKINDPAYKDVIGYYNGEMVIDPFNSFIKVCCGKNNIGSEETGLMGDTTGVLPPQMREEEPDVLPPHMKDEEPLELPNPVFSLSKTIKKDTEEERLKNLMKKQRQEENEKKLQALREFYKERKLTQERERLMRREEEKRKSTKWKPTQDEENNYMRIVQEIFGDYTNRNVTSRYKNVVSKYKNRNLVYVGFLESGMMFKITEYQEMNQEDMEALQEKEDYDIETSNLAANYGLSWRIYHSHSFTNVGYPLLVGSNKIIIIRLMENMNGVTVDKLDKTFDLDEFGYKNLVNAIYSGFIHLHKYGIYHGNVNYQNVFVRINIDEDPDSDTYLQQLIDVKFTQFEIVGFFGEVNKMRVTKTTKIQSENDLNAFKKFLIGLYDTWMLCLNAKREYLFYVPKQERMNFESMNNPNAIHYMSVVFGSYFALFAMYLFTVDDYKKQLDYANKLKSLSNNISLTSSLLLLSLPEITMVLKDKNTPYKEILEKVTYETLTNPERYPKSRVYKMDTTMAIEEVQNHIINGDGYDEFVYLVVTLAMVGNNIPIYVTSEFEETHDFFKITPVIDEDRRL